MAISYEAKGLNFEKIEANGNDFVLCDRVPDRSWFELLCDRHHGVGADGVMVFQGVAGADVRLDHYDPDGARSLCINGIRAALTCLAAKGHVPPEGRVHIQEQQVAYQLAGRVQLRLAGAPYRPMTWRHGKSVLGGFFVDVGNPHFISLAGVPTAQFATWAPLIRADHDTFPAGVNVHLVEPTHRGWRIRSYERGVEDFTKACGSGILAAAIVLTGEGAGDHLSFRPDGRGFVTIQKRKDQFIMEGSAHWVASGVWRCGL